MMLADALRQLCDGFVPALTLLRLRNCVLSTASFVFFRVAPACEPALLSIASD